MAVTRDFIWAHYTDFFRYATVMMKNRADAEDVVQETFFKLLKNKIDIDDEEELKRYSFRVLQNECRLFYRQFWNRHLIPEKIEDLVDKEAAANDGDMDESIDLLKAVLSLPLKLRSCVYLFYYKNYSVREIAEIAGKNENTIKTYLQRGRKLLRKELGDGYRF